MDIFKLYKCDQNHSLEDILNYVIKQFQYLYYILFLHVYRTLQGYHTIFMWNGAHYNVLYLYILCADVLREMVLTYQSECVHTIVPVLTQVHLAFQESNMPGKYMYQTISWGLKQCIRFNGYPEFILVHCISTFGKHQQDIYTCTLYMTVMTIHNINFKLILIIEIKGSFIMKFVHKICDIAPMC